MAVDVKVGSRATGVTREMALLTRAGESNNFWIRGITGRKISSHRRQQPIKKLLRSAAWPFIGRSLKRSTIHGREMSTRL